MAFTVSSNKGYFNRISSTTMQAQSTWKLDDAHSKIGFAITRIMISEVERQFWEFDITVTASDDFDSAAFDVTIKLEMAQQ